MNAAANPTWFNHNYFGLDKSFHYICISSDGIKTTTIKLKPRSLRTARHLYMQAEAKHNTNTQPCKDAEVLSGLWFMSLWAIEWAIAGWHKLPPGPRSKEPVSKPTSGLVWQEAASSHIKLPLLLLTAAHCCGRLFQLHHSSTQQQLSLCCFGK